MWSLGSVKVMRRQDTQRFWMDLFQKVLGVEYPAKHLLFEKRVKEEYDCGKITSTAHGEPLQLRHPFLQLQHSRDKS